jgi:hypothetical protein
MRGINYQIVPILFNAGQLKTAFCDLNLSLRLERGN